MEDETTGPLEIVRDVLETSRMFYQNVRYLDGHTRNQVVALHERNANLALSIVSRWIQQPVRTTMVMNFPIDLSGSFMDPIPVLPTPAQVAAATELQSDLQDTQCSICQETITSGLSIRHCGHCFHLHCIHQWFTLNPRCPVCRYDIRDFQPNPLVEPNDHSMHSHT
jgi:hypothetical protein